VEAIHFAVRRHMCGNVSRTGWATRDGSHAPLSPWIQAAVSFRWTAKISDAARVGQAFVPPSTVRLAPVMYDASGPATNATKAATSSTVL
jgi:hypothetical protein